jgi:hypothetical protein
MQAQGIPLHSSDSTQYSKYQPIVKAADFAMQHSGMTEGQALQALDSMQRQLAPRQPRSSASSAACQTWPTALHGCRT